MTRDETTAHALCREAEPILRRMGLVTTAHYDAMIPLIAAALAGEREACARVAESLAEAGVGAKVAQLAGRMYAAAIRARGQTP